MMNSENKSNLRSLVTVNLYGYGCNPAAIVDLRKDLEKDHIKVRGKHLPAAAPFLSCDLIIDFIDDFTPELLSSFLIYLLKKISSQILKHFKGKAQNKMAVISSRDYDVVIFNVDIINGIIGEIFSEIKMLVNENNSEDCSIEKIYLPLQAQPNNIYTCGRNEDGCPFIWGIEVHTSSEIKRKVYDAKNKVFLDDIDFEVDETIA